MVRFGFFLFVTLLPLVAALSQAQPSQTKRPAPEKPKTILTQKRVAELILQQAPKTQEVDLKYQVLQIEPVRVLSNFDWKLTVETGNEVDKTESISTVTVNAADVQRYKTVLGLTKILSTGTLLSVDASRTSNRVNPDTFTVVNGVTMNPSTYDSWSLGLEQSLWGNFFGQADRARLRASEKSFEAQTLLRRDELQTVVLDGLRLFWNTYVAQESFQEAMQSRDRYEKLVVAVKKKSSVGYSSPGELLQVMAEYETRLQTVKTASTDYLQRLDELMTFLNLSPEQEIAFYVPKDFPAVPQLKSINTEDLRALRSQKLKLESAEDSMTEYRSLSRPRLSLIGKYTATGLEEKSSDSFQELNSGNRAKTYVGLKFVYNFGSNTPEEELLNRKLNRDLEQVRLSTKRSELQNTLTNAERKVEAHFMIAQSAQKQKELREKAVQELNRSFNQGRTDISVLIEAMNKFFTSEVAAIKAIGDYYIALNEWAAQRDELIPETGESK